jgi:hypothetical protein
MNAEQFCAEHGKECKNGRITFSKNTVDRFIKTYTYFSVEDFDKEARKRLILFVMIDLHLNGYTNKIFYGDQEIHKIEIPTIVFSK